MRAFPYGAGTPATFPLETIRVGNILGLVIFSALMCTLGCRREGVSTTADALRLILKYNKESRRDDAIKVALDRLRVEPNDVDVHATVALIYLEKAESDSVHRNELGPVHTIAEPRR